MSELKMPWDEIRKDLDHVSPSEQNLLHAFRRWFIPSISNYNGASAEFLRSLNTVAELDMLAILSVFSEAVRFGAEQARQQPPGEHIIPPCKECGGLCPSSGCCRRLRAGPQSEDPRDARIRQLKDLLRECREVLRDNLKAYQHKNEHSMLSCFTKIDAALKGHQRSDK